MAMFDYGRIPLQQTCETNDPKNATDGGSVELNSSIAKLSIARQEACNTGG